jgi:hypothetical protein
MKTNLTITLSILLITIKAFGQINIPLPAGVYFDQIIGESYFETNTIFNARIKNKIKTEEITTINRKGKSSIRIIQYNRLGRLIYSKSENIEMNNTYLNDTLPIQTIWKGKNRTYETNKIYDEKYNLLSEIQKKNDKITSKCLFTYNSNNTITNRFHLFGNKLKHSSEMRYFYNQENKINKTQFFRDGKLKTEWNYDCNSQGEIKKDVDSKNICKWTEELENGNYTTYTRTNFENKSYLTKNQFTKDSILFKVENFINDSTLIYSEIINKDSKIVRRYSEKGKMKGEKINIYLDDMLQFKSRFSLYLFSKKYKSEEYFYDNQKNKVKEIRRVNGKTISTTNIKYTFY